MTAQSRPESPGTQPLRFGKYVLLDRINVGGMAEVFKAKAFGVEGFEKIVAIKRILPTMSEVKQDLRGSRAKLGHRAQQDHRARRESRDQLAQMLTQSRRLAHSQPTTRSRPQMPTH